MSEDVLQINYSALPHQIKTLNSRKKITFLGGGVGCGKTDCGSLWTIKKICETPPKVKGLISANSYTQLRDSTLANFYENIEQWGLIIYPEEPPKSNRPFDLRVWNGRTWVEVLCRSLNNFVMLSGVQFGWWWADETFQTSKEAIDLLMARLRDPKMPLDKLQGLMTTTLDDPSTWMYNTFVENFNEKTMLVHYATTYDNKNNLPKWYIEDLKSLYSDQMFRRMCLSQWVALEGIAIYHAFNRNDHVKSFAEYNKDLTIHWSHDFNIGQGKPASSCLCHILKSKSNDDVVRTEIHVFDEIILETSDTNDVIVEFDNRYNTKDVVIYGDASGHHNDTRSKTTDYILLEEAGYNNQRVPLSNPPIRNRHNAVNRMLRAANNDIRVFINPRCKTLIKGLEIVKLKKGSGYIEEEIYSQHVTTALGYLVHELFPIDSNKKLKTSRLLG